MNPMHSCQQSFSVPVSYPVVFTRNAFCVDNPGLLERLATGTSSKRRVLMVVDEGVARAFPGYTARAETWFSRHHDKLDLVAPPEVVSGGEAIKNDYRRVMSLVDMMLEHHLCRHSVVLVVGGGAVLDAVGFAASLVHRGLRLVRMPSTTLAQNDAGIGVKNGMNLHGGKNTIGVFAAPFGVLNDLDLLDGLDDTNWRAGISEAFKVAMIKDAAFFRELCRLAPRLAERDPSAMERLVVRCAALHLDHIATSGDPFELGSARPLDFGHWAAHKIESLGNYRTGHGAAVAVGLAVDSLYASRIGWLDPADAQRLLEALSVCGFDLARPELRVCLGDGRPAVLQGLEEFREHLGGTLTLSLPRPLGQKDEIHAVDENLMTEILREVASRGPSQKREALATRR